MPAFGFEACPIGIITGIDSVRIMEASVPALVPTLNTLLGRADQLFEEARLGKALEVYEQLLAQSQETLDRSTEVIARCRIAECFVMRNEPFAAEEQLQRAKERLDDTHLRVVARYRWAHIRWVLATEDVVAKREALNTYIHWADGAAQYALVIDGCRLMADHGPEEDRISWLERALQVGQESQTTEHLGRNSNDLAAALDGAGRASEALETYEMALGWHRLRGSVRDQVGACWAIGSVALREEDFPLAFERLNEAVAMAGNAPEHQDLLALSLADLARAHFETGDVIESRRVLLSAMEHARAVDLATTWNQAWQNVHSLAKALDLAL